MDSTSPLLHASLAHQAARRPEAVALVAGDAVWSYHRLWRAAGGVAAALDGLPPEGVVAVRGRRRPETVAALLGVLRAGGAYLYLDPSLPPARQRLLLEDAGAVRVLEVDGGLPAEARSEGVAPQRSLHPDQLAYLVYTSGSTGRPKAVLGHHRGAAHYVDGILDRFALGPEDRTLQLAPFAYDRSVRDLWAPLAAGARVVLAPDSDPVALLDFLEAQGITVVPSLVPALLAPLLAAADLRPRRLDALRLLGFAGEPLPLAEAHRARRQWGVTVVNLYGPTETTCTATHHALSAADPESGHAVAGRADRDHRVILLADGEIALAGPGVARGYRGRPRETALAFRPDPTAPEPGERCYHTGDLGHWDDRRRLVLRGRRDRQVKIAGHRVELGEVEAALRALPEVAQGVVEAREVGGVTGLVGCVVLAGEEGTLGESPVPRGGQARGPAPTIRSPVGCGKGQEGVPLRLPPRPLGEGDRGGEGPGLLGPRGDFLRQALATQLPAHAIPATFVVLRQFPLTASGKIDRRALRSLTAKPGGAGTRAPGGEGRAPRTGAERALAQLWSEVLGIPAGAMGATANFLALGGDSLALLRLLARIAEVFRVEVPLGDLFAAPSLSAMATRIAAGSREARQAPPAPPATMGAVAIDTPMPLTPEEHGLWLAHGLEPTSTAYHVGVAWRLEGRLSVPALAAAWAGLVHRQEILRSVFGEDPRDGAPRVRRGSGPIAPLKVVDLSPTLQDAAVVALGAAFVARPFSLRAGPLARALLLRSAPDRWLLVLAFHHLVVDGPSEAILARELGALYGGAQLLPLPSLPSPPQVPARVSAASPGAEARLRPLPPLPPLPPLALPTDRVPGAAPGRSRRSGSVALPLAPAVPGTPVGGVTPFQGAATALMVLLARWTNTARPWFATPVTTRFGAALDARVGFFVRTAAVAATVDRDPTLGDLLARVVPRVVAALTAGAPGSVSTGGAAGAAGRDAVVLAVTATAALAMPGLRAERVVLPRQGGWHGRVPLEFQWSIEPGGGVLQLLYDADLFDDTTAQRLAAAFRRLVGAVAATPSVRLSAAPWLSPAEEHQLAWEWSRDASTVPGSPDDSALARIAAWGRRTPTATAVAGEFPSWSFERLVGEAATRAAVLRRRLRSPAAASRREPLVAVCGERSPEWVATILGVLGAGAAFLLLDPTAPQRRLRALLRQGGVAGVVVTSGGEGVWAALRGLEIPLWGELAGSGEAEILAKTVPPLDPAALAYVLYTSGSTGQPKGVEIPHQGLVGLMHHQARRFQWGPGSRVLQIAAPCFDAVIAEIFVTLGGGATLVLPSRAAQRPGPALLETFERQGITAVTLIPSVLAALPRAPLRGVQTLISAGEPCSAAVARRWSPGRTFLNAYGPTEGTVCATVATLTASGVAAQPAARALAVGRPLAHARVYILDAALRPVPAGATGELFLGGTGLARGYRGQPRRTAAAFRPDPFAGPGWEGGRLYATGDLARFRGDGQVEILGRRDDQLKVQGVRIEPAEIEAVLLSHGSVAQAVVAVPVEDTATASRLVAYLVPRPGERIVPEVVRAFLARRLPTTMVPSVFLEVAALPRTATGKLDRRALPPPPRSAGGRPPSTPTERRLATVWQAVLGLEAVAVEDDFFALGGNSILVLKVVAETRRRGLALTVGQLFEHSTLGALARVLEVPTSRATPRWGVA